MPKKRGGTQKIVTENTQMAKKAAKRATKGEQEQKDSHEQPVPEQSGLWSSHKVPETRSVSEKNG